MIRKLLIVFVSGLILSILLISAAWVLGGDQLAARFKHDHGDWNFDRDDGPTVKRSLTFDGARILTIDGPVSLRFVRGPKAEMTVSGAARAMDGLRWEDGELSFEHHGWRHNGGITVEITAPQIAGLTLRGPGHIRLENLDQPSLRLEVRGPADLDASGKVGKLDIDSRGVGTLDLADVETGDATVRVRGVGNVDIKASGTVDASLNGVGNITLHRKPASLNAETHGVGEIRHEYDDGKALKNQ
jgi:hypothetical protein